MLGTLSHWKHLLTERNSPPLRNTIFCHQTQKHIEVSLDWVPGVSKCLVFRKSKDLYLIITQKLIILKSVKSGGFHHEIQWISWNLADFRWNPADFMKSGRFQVKSSRFHLKSTHNLTKSDVSTKTLQFGGVHGGGYDPRFHEIQGHSPSPAFIKLDSFCWNTCFYKVLGGFHMKSAGFHLKSARCHADFMKSGRFHVKSKDPLAKNCNPMFNEVTAQ